MTVETKEGECGRERGDYERHQRPLPAALGRRAHVRSLWQRCRRERPLRHDRARRSFVTSLTAR